MGDRWLAGSAYERFMGRWSRALAVQFTSWVNLPAGLHWLDVGCGTGALTRAIVEAMKPASVVACDPAAPLVDSARQQLQDVRVSFRVAGAGNLPRREDGYGSISSLLVLNFLPSPEAALREMVSLATAGGTVSACVWDYRGRMEMLRYFWDAVTRTDPAAAPLDEGNRFRICEPGPLKRLWEERLVEVKCEALEIRTNFASFDDYWEPFLGGTGPAPSYVATLNAPRRADLARNIRETLPVSSDGTIELVARAWAVRGRVDGRPN
ncbi:MAG: methyltransferase domain-containing protein [Actinobacteria bacterium]|nr:methyltransferase domain-containing protein [Actinomycetota bacterium]